MAAWRKSFFRRLRHHANLVCQNDHKNLSQTTINEEIIGIERQRIKCKHPHAPVLIAFSGKRQFSYLFSPPLSKIDEYGKQTKLPTEWPQELQGDSEVWVLPSSSGRAAMTTAQRTLPYKQLAERMYQFC